MGRVKPFAFTANLLGQDERKGYFLKEPTAAARIENLHMDAMGEWTANNNGYAHLGDQFASAPRVDGIGVFRDVNQVERLVAVVNGDAYDVDFSTGAQTGKSGAFTAGQVVDMAAFKGTLFMVDGNNRPQKWDGTGSAGNVSAIPLTVGSETYNNPKYVTTHQNRLVYANFNDSTKYPSHLAISSVLTPDTFTIGTGADDANVIQVAPGDGQQITGLVSMFIPASDSPALVIFKERSVYALLGRDNSDFALVPINATTGALSNKAIVKVGSDVLYLGEDNIYSLTTALQSGTIQPTVVGSENVKTTLRTLNLTAKEKAWAVHLSQRQEVWFFIPVDADAESSIAIVYRYPKNQDEAPIFSIKTGLNHTCGVALDNDLYTGTADGYLATWFGQSLYQDTSVQWTYEFAPYAFNSPTQNKQIKNLDLWFLVRSEETVEIETSWEYGGNSATKTTQLRLSPAAGVSQYGSSSPPAAVFGTSLYGDGKVLLKAPVKVYGSGQFFKLKAVGNVSSDGLTFLGATGIAEYGGIAGSYK